jgi:soluble lytic murein transglycosylase-like protein
MPAPCKLPVIPLFGQNSGHSSAPATVRTAVARSGSPGRPSGRRVSASPLTAASTMAALRSLTAILGFVAVFVSSMLLNGAAHAERVSQSTHRARSESLPPFAAIVAEASSRFGVPEHWIRAVIRVESGAKQRVRSTKGAMGLMQIMPGTWKELRVRHGLGTDPYDPHDNILAGTAYIRELHDRYGMPGFLAAYNAGPGRYERHLATGRPLPAETQAYVAALAPIINRAPANLQLGAVARSFAWANSSLFATRTAGIPQDGRSPVDLRQNRSSRAHAIVDLSALVPRSGHLFVRPTREIRSP